MAKLDVVIPAVEVEVNGVKYRKVDRKAQAGDIVRAKHDEFDIEAGAYYEVIKDGGSVGFYDDAEDFRISVLEDVAEDFEVYEKVTEQPKPARLTVGDYAKVIADDGDNYYVGKIIRITHDEEDSVPYRGVYADGTDPEAYLRESEVVPATEAEFNAQRPKPERLKVGEYAKVTADNYEHCAGHFIQITGYTSGTFDYAVKRITLGGTGYIAHKNIVRATEAEVVAAKKKAEEEAARKAEEAKWDAIDRKVNEYKAGDIVQIIANTNSSVNKVGSYGEVTDGPKMSGSYRVETGAGSTGNLTRPTDMRLIVPVEQRFDTKEAA